MEKFLVISDWDGTLYKQDNDHTTNTLKKINSMGGKIVISTGRRKQNFFQNFDKFELDRYVSYYVFGDGTEYVPKDGESVYYTFGRSLNKFIMFISEDTTRIAVRFRETNGDLFTLNRLDLINLNEVTEICISTMGSKYLLSKYLAIAINFGYRIRVLGDCLWIHPEGVSKIQTPLMLESGNRYEKVFALGNDYHDYEFLGNSGVLGMIISAEDTADNAIYKKIHK